MSSLVKELIHGVDGAAVIIVANIGHLHEAEHQLSQLTLAVSVFHLQMLIQLAALYAGVDTGGFARGLAAEQGDADIGVVGFRVFHGWFPHFLYVPFGQVYYLILYSICQIQF